MNLIPSWENLRVIGKSKIVGLTVLIPFIGYLLLFNQNVVSFISLASGIIGEETHPNAPHLRLLSLYFGLTVIGFSSIAFAWLCPSEIKLSESEYDYSQKEINVMSEARLIFLCDSYSKVLKSHEESYNELEKYVNSYKFSINEANRVHSMNENRAFEYASELRSSARLDILRFSWNYKNKCKFYARLLIAFGYGTGFLFLAIPSAEVFFKVVANLKII